MAKKSGAWPITGRARPFSDDEAKIFNHAVALVSAHGRQESMFIAGRTTGELAYADVGPFRIERMLVADGWEKEVRIGISRGGTTVFKASFEQWRRPRRKRELSIACDVPDFVRGEWEAALLQLR